jgi:hypothetical protein
MQNGKAVCPWGNIALAQECLQESCSISNFCRFLVEEKVLCTAGALDFVTNLVCSRPRRDLYFLLALEARNSNAFCTTSQQLVSSRPRILGFTEITSKRASNLDFGTSFGLIPIIISARAGPEHTSVAGTLSSPDFGTRHRSFWNCVIGTRSRIVISYILLAELLSNGTSLILSKSILVCLVLAWSRASIKCGIGFKLVAETILRTCAEGSTANVVTRPWVFVSSSQTFSS